MNKKMSIYFVLIFLYKMMQGQEFRFCEVFSLASLLPPLHIMLMLFESDASGVHWRSFLVIKNTEDQSNMSKWNITPVHNTEEESMYHSRYYISITIKRSFF